MTALVPIRPEPQARYKTFIKRTILSALKSVFTSEYPDEEFQNMQVVTDYPLKKIAYPMMVVKFIEGDVGNLGLRHEEWGFDTTGQWRKFFHFRFGGSLEFHLYTLSPFSRDILSDTLVEMLAFGRLQNLTNQFFQIAFDQDFQNGGQLMLATDMIDALGSSEGPTGWDAEDTVVYQCGYSIKCDGAFYSTGNSELMAFIDKVIVLPYIEGTDVPSGSVEVDWSPTQTFEDSGVVTSEAVISGTELYNA